jgi:hypothetical protein
MEEIKKYIMLALAANIEPFTSSWGAECRPSYDEVLDKWLLTVRVGELSWTERGIDI